MSKILNAIRQAFKRGVKTRYQVSEETKVDQAALSRLMKGGTLTVANAEKVAEALNLEIIVRQKEEKKT